MTDTLRWKKMANSFLAQAKRAEEDLRCPKELQTTVYYGDFVEMPSRERCFLDVGHEGECMLRFAWEKREQDPNTKREHPLS